MKTTRFQIKYREFVNTLKHEYRFIFHDPGAILIIIGAIFIYSLAYSLAYGPQVLRNIPIAVVDHSNTASSRQLCRAMDATPNLWVAYKPTSMIDAKELFLTRKINGIVVIPSDYEKKLMRAEKVNLAVYADASYFLMYRQVFFDISKSVLTTGAEIEWLRFVSKGVPAKQAATLSDPVGSKIENLYNPYGGYATFIMPAILMVIIQQTLLVGIGLIGGTWRERGLYRSLVPKGEKRLSVLPMVLGKSVVYLSIYTVTLLYVLGFHYKIFGYPMHASFLQVVLFLLPYLLSCIFMGIALSTVFRHRENSLLFLLFASIPFLMLSGASIPKESMPDWLFTLGKAIPSSSAVDGFIRLQSMGASLSEISVPWITLWILTGVYLVLACIGIRLLMHRIEREEEQEAAKISPELPAATEETPIVSYHENH